MFSSKTRDFSERPKTTPQPKLTKTDILLNFSILKNFFECPYRFKLLTLYGFYQPLSARLGYGKSIHDCLMEVHKETLDSAGMDRTHIPRLLETHLHLPYALEAVREDMRVKAEAALNQYFDLNEHAFKDILFAEKEIQLDLGDGILVNTITSNLTPSLRSNSLTMLKPSCCRRMVGGLLSGSETTATFGSPTARAAIIRIS
jgi:DNA helicase-2/ATP-dependent DNA helicase PcrA